MGIIQAGNQDESSEDGERIWGTLDSLLRTFLKTNFMVPAEKGDRRRQMERGGQTKRVGWKCCGSWSAEAKDQPLWAP